MFRRAKSAIGNFSMLNKTTTQHQYRHYARQNPKLFQYLAEGEGNLHTPYPVATVFGATGYIGKYICAELARIGYQVITPYRYHEEQVMKHRVMGDVGQMVAMRYSSRQYASIVDICARSNIVVCAAGRNNTPLYEVSDSFYYSNVELPRLVAQACADTNVSRLIYLSHQGANQDSSNTFLRYKSMAEQAVRSEYPDATIFRPNIAVGGFPDPLCTMFGKWCRNGSFPIPQSGQRTFQPIYAPNIADAVIQSLKRPYTLAQTYELAGPHKMTYADFASKVTDYCNWPADVENKRFPLRKFFHNHDLLPLPLQQVVYRQAPHYWALMEEELVVPEGTRNTIQSLGILPSPVEHSIELSLEPYMYSPDVAGSFVFDVDATTAQERKG
eukprot:CAMPEP_0117446102 /NCGR_PEP_ID=MMETSP0759-20121206/6152_1 /TAXON_ID=63605 /ORGANISM="Percolomonas cosmopolitus, Strain WS" /LENGTH=384 /DNA_ID=CAMNT_0005238327 /DNA_START=222 /DNA_END=1376 /DNA_ORIENTATION=+